MNSWFRFFSRRKRMMEDLDQDIRDYIERETQDNIERSMSTEEARYAALRKFGNVTRVKEDTWEVWGFVWLEQLWQDVRVGLRMLAKSPGFTAVAVLTLALGIGATTAIFSVVDAVMIRPLPFHDAEQLVALWAKGSHYDQMSVSGPDYLDWVKGSGAFSALAAGAIDDPTVTGYGDPEHLYGIQVTPNFFQVLGVQPSIGRAFFPGENQVARGNVVILGYSTWQRKFGGDPSIVGKDIMLDGEAYAVVGIMPGTFRFPQVWGITDPYVYLPFTISRLDQHRENRWIWVMGRMKRGVSLAQVRAQMSTIAGRLAQQYPETNKGTDVNVMPLKEEVEGGTGPVLLLLLGAVGMMLLIGCANVANMQLARTMARQREVAVRLTMGASRWRIVRQLLTESVLLALAAAAVGVLIAAALKQVLVASSPQRNASHDKPHRSELLGAGVLRYSRGGIRDSFRARTRFPSEPDERSGVAQGGRAILQRDFQSPPAGRPGCGASGPHSRAADWGGTCHAVLEEHGKCVDRIRVHPRHHYEHQPPGAEISEAGPMSSF